ncbi:MAG: hypothetical protein KAS84_01600 [Anaerolineales bacterium]|nr:hypothetical protein [Anaerolineales bacterium]
MKKVLIFLLAILLLLLPTGVLAQQAQPGLQLGLIRNFGYGGLGKIQGRFTLRINDPPAQLETVEFYFDDKLILMSKESPYEFKFHTSNFQDGEHVFSAVGNLKDGTQVESNRITKVFLSSEQAWVETQDLLVPLLLFTGILTVLGLAVPILASRKKEFVLGKYSPAGGVVCPRCELPFSRSILAPNLLVGKLVRCPHCEKISVRSRASLSQLQEAENKFRNNEPGMVTKNADQDYRKLLDESRYEE